MQRIANNYFWCRRWREEKMLRLSSLFILLLSLSVCPPPTPYSAPSSSSSVQYKTKRREERSASQEVYSVLTLNVLLSLLDSSSSFPFSCDVNSSPDAFCWRGWDHEMLSMSEEEEVFVVKTYSFTLLFLPPVIRVLSRENNIKIRKNVERNSNRMRFIYFPQESPRSIRDTDDVSLNKISKERKRNEDRDLPANTRWCVDWQRTRSRKERDQTYMLFIVDLLVWHMIWRFDLTKHSCQISTFFLLVWSFYH